MSKLQEWLETALLSAYRILRLQRQPISLVCCKSWQLMIKYLQRPGGLAPFVNVTEANCHVVPESIPLDVAALYMLFPHPLNTSLTWLIYRAEPLSVAWHAVRRANIKGGETIVCLSVALNPTCSNAIRAAHSRIRSNRCSHMPSTESQRRFQDFRFGTITCASSNCETMWSR